MDVALAIEIMYKPQSNLEEKVRLSILKDDFSLKGDKNRPIYFHISKINVFRPVKWYQLSFSSIATNKPLPALVYNVL